MPIDRSVIQRPWFWPALLVAAIAAGAIVEWARTPPAPSTGTPPAVAPTTVAPRADTPRAPDSAPDLTGLRRAPEGPEEPPIVHAEIPRPHPPPGTEPPVPLTANRVIDPQRVLDDSARRWADSVRGVRPDILEQMRLGKMQERERVQKDIAALEESLRENQGDEALSRRLETLQNNLYYLDRSIAYLEKVQEESR